MNEKKMQKTEMEFIRFDTADVITTSGGMDAKGQNPSNDYGEIVAGIGNLNTLGSFGQPLQ